jgi:arabinan endo-1,5-alpha-L-arabinosidase
VVSGVESMLTKIGKGREFRMKSALLAALALGSLATAPLALALDGQIGIHDPSTITLSNGKYYVWGTGGSPLVSDDGWTWRAGVRPLHTGAAPDVIHIGDRYYMYSTQGRGGASASDIVMAWTKTLDPTSPDYKWIEGGTVASSDGIEDSNAIDPGLLLDPTTGRLWMVYGSYIGYIRLVELDPKTGKRFGPRTIKDPKTGKVTTNPDKPIDLAITCEASDLIYHDGWYYLLATHGSCCRGADSGYNIRMGRSRKVTGPYIDAMGVDMIKAGGKQLIGSGGRLIGPGHFGMMDLGQGIYKFSMHWEADLDRGGASILDIRPLLWKDGWPLAGENLKDGTYEIQSPRTGNALELAVEGVPVGGARGGRGGGAGRGAGAPGAGRGGPGAPAGPGQAAAPGGRAQGAPTDAAAAGRGGQAAPGGPGRGAAAGRGGGGGMFGGTGGGPIANQDVAEVSKNWPAGNLDIRMSNYMCQAQQKWAFTAANAGGYPGAPYVKIQIAGTDRTLAATPDAELVVLPAFTGAPEQLWRVEQVAEGEWRIVPKAVAGSKDTLALTAEGSGFATLTKYDPASDKQRWTLKQP